MRKKEQRLYDSFKRNAPKTAWIQRVENIMIAGMPDVYVDGPETTAWVELKAPTKPKRETTRLLGAEGLNPDQINWHLKAASKSSRAFILIRDDAGELSLVDGKFAAEMNDWPVGVLRERRIASEWDEIFKCIMGWEE